MPESMNEVILGLQVAQLIILIVVVFVLAERRYL